jgi:hypothetical protein
MKMIQIAFAALTLALTATAPNVAGGRGSASNFYKRAK